MIIKYITIGLAVENLIIKLIIGINLDTKELNIDLNVKIVIIDLIARFWCQPNCITYLSKKGYKFWYKSMIDSYDIILETSQKYLYNEIIFSKFW